MWSNTRLRDVNDSARDASPSSSRFRDASPSSSRFRDASPSSSRFGSLGGSFAARNRTGQPLDCKVCKVVSDIPWWLGRTWHKLLALAGGSNGSNGIAGSHRAATLGQRRLAALAVGMVAVLLAGAWWRAGGGIGWARLDLGGAGGMGTGMGVDPWSRWRSLLGDSERLLWLEKSMAQLRELLAAGLHREHSHDAEHSALAADVRRLEAAVESVRRDVQHLLGLGGGGTGSKSEGGGGGGEESASAARVAAQVRQELQAMLLARPHGDQLAPTGSSSSSGLLPFPGSGESSSPLSHWLQQHYVSRDELKAALGALKVERSAADGGGGWCRAGSGGGGVSGGGGGFSSGPVSEEQVDAMIRSALRLYSEDRVGMADYALESGGGGVLRTHASGAWSIGGGGGGGSGGSDCNSKGYSTKQPRVALQPGNLPGNCWGFAGSQGKLVIRLSMRVRPTAFTLEHVPRALALAGHIRSAPRDFSVYGLDEDDAAAAGMEGGGGGGGGGGTLLGSYTYDQDGEALQTFWEDQSNQKAFSLVEVNVLSNWGHPDYTCMYRFRVHGTPES